MQLQVYLDAVTDSPLEVMQQPFSGKTTLLVQELHFDKQYGVGGLPLWLLSLGSSLFLFSSCTFFCLFFSFFLLMKGFQMEVVYTEYLLYMF